MTIRVLGALAFACAGAAAALAQEQPAALDGISNAPPPALSPRPKPLTRPNPFDGGPTAIANGTGFLLGWQSGPDFAANGTGVFAQQFSNVGKPLSKIATLRRKTPGLIGRPKFAPVAAGKFAAVWASVTQDFNQTPIVEGGIYDPATNKIGRVMQLATATDAIHEIIPLTTGNVALMTQQENKRTFPFSVQVVVSILNGTTLKVINGPTSVNGAGQGDIGQTYDHTLVQRQAGGFAIWRNRNAQPNVIMMDGFNQAAVPDGNPIQVNTTPFLTSIGGSDLLKFSIRAARLSNGNVIVTWANYEAAENSYEIRARLFKVVNNNASPIGRDFLVNRVKTNDQYWPKPIALDSGRFAVAYLSEEAFNERRHYIAVFDATGKAVGRPILTQKVANPPQVTVDNSLVRLTDKSVVDVFSDVDFKNGRILGDGIPTNQVK